jgi:type II secretory pathway component GspD/PulD (secretin)
MTYRTRVVIGCAIAAALVVGSAAAQEPPAGRVVRVAEDPLARRVSLDLKAMAPADAFGALASSAGLKVVVDPAVTASVDIVVRNVTARTALTTMCESIGCEWSVAAGILSIKPARASEPGAVTYAVRRQSSPEVNRMLELFRKALPASLKFENAPLSKVSEGLSQALGIRVVLSSDDPALQNVTIDFSQTTLEAGLKKLSELASGQYRLTARLGAETSGKEPSVLISIHIGKPGQVKK